MAAMSNSLYFFMCLVIFGGAIMQTVSGQLTPNYYDPICPAALPTIRLLVLKAIIKEPRMGASLLRLHFHDCFVNGCDGSNLLDDTPTLKGEKTAFPNLNSLRGFEVIDSIKETLNFVCHGNKVSCADILAVAARDSVNILGGGFYQVLLGRKDSLTASFDAANNGLAAPFLDLPGLLAIWQNHGLNLQDLVVLSGGHSIGLARCSVYKSRLANDLNMDPLYRSFLQKSCPNPAAQDNNTAPLDFSSTRFDTNYYQNLIQNKGLLHSDQELYKGGNSESDNLVRFYSKNISAFWKDFGNSMIKMGNMGPLTGLNGQIRWNCRRINYK